MNSLQRADSNWRPRSVVTVEGIPNREIWDLVIGADKVQLRENTAAM